MLLALALALQSPATPASFQPESPTVAETTIGASTKRIETPDQALALLADRRFAAQWPAILAWAGDELARLRDAQVAAAEADVARGRTKRDGDGVSAIVRPKLRATMLLADALWDAGREDAAIALIERARDDRATRSTDRTRNGVPEIGAMDAVEWTALVLWLSDAAYARGDTARAIAIIDGGLPPVANTRARLNLDVTRIRLLIEAGRAAETLAALDAAEALFRSPGGGGPFSHYSRAPASDRRYAGIRACALTQLGRADEAKAVAAPLFAVAPDEKAEVVDVTIAMRQGLARCTGDVAMAARAYADALAPGRDPRDALLELQPGRRRAGFDPDFMAQVREHPTLAPVLAERMRVLPDALLPALNRWR